MARVNIKADESTRNRLQVLKRDRETWDDLLNRLAEYGELVEHGREEPNSGDREGTYTGDDRDV